MTGGGKSDWPVVPEKPPNKEGGAPSSAEAVEGRGWAKGNTVEQTRVRAQNRGALPRALDRVRRAARRERGLRFTTLWHHVYDIDRLRAAFFALKRTGAPGVDGVTWQQYEEHLEANLGDLSARLKRGAYRTKPVRRAYIPKPDGRQRPIGVPTLEDKLAQRVVAEVMGAIYEADFKGFSYGFRPGRGQHNALDAVVVAIQRKKVSWVLDADIRGFFDAIDHGWMRQFVEHRIADQRVVRQVKQWLEAGVLEDGKRRVVECGTPQGGSISPLLANIYLHYVLDLWVDQWRRTQTHNDVIIVRYADDFILGFQTRADAERFRHDLEQRLARFKLELNGEKTRLIEFGRFADQTRARKGVGKPETFDFLGFTHYCGRTRNGGFVVKRRSIRKRVRAKLTELKHELMRRRHEPVPKVALWLRSVVEGHFRYYGVPHNIRALTHFRYQVVRRWYRALKRRSQKSRLTWERMTRISNLTLPHPRILHPYPEQRLCVTTSGRSPVR